MKKHMRTALFPLALLLLAGCGGDAAVEAGMPLVRDSAGIQIVENAAPAWGEGEGWRLSPAPVLQIGELEGAPAYQFDRIGSALRLADGRIVVANTGSQELRFYDASGAHLRSVGGEGGGPGEFEWLVWVEATPGDSLVAYDLRSRRLSVFSPTGEFVRSTTLEGRPEGGIPQVMGRFEDRSLLVSIPRGIGARGNVEGGLSQDSTPYLHLSAEGKLLDTITHFAGAEHFIYRESDGFTVTRPLFGRTSVQALHADRVTLGASDSYELAQYSAKGELQRIIRKRHNPRPIADADWEAAKQERLDAEDEAWRQRTVPLLEAMPRPATLPAYAELLADTEGNLWVQDYPIPGDSEQRWTVFDPDGRLLGTVLTPERFRPTQVGSDFVLGVWRDELDVQYVTMYALEKPGSGPAG